MESSRNVDEDLETNATANSNFIELDTPHELENVYTAEEFDEWLAKLNKKIDAAA